MVPSTLDPQVQQVLNDIAELGYVRVHNGNIIHLIPPKFLFETVATRWAPTVRYIADYADEHKKWEGEFFVCLYDGWREYSPFVDSKSRKYVPWHELDHNKFLGVGIANEPRFRHRHEDSTIYPEMPRKVLTYNRHRNDQNAVLIPDAEFLSNQFGPYLRQVEANDISWQQKLSKAVWRGSNLVMNGISFYDNEPGSQRLRDEAVTKSKNSEFSKILDAAYVPTPISWMLKHKYLLDLDGTVNAWSALYWKMSSNSLVWKMKSNWEQWYYNKLVPKRNYIPLDDFASTWEVFRWCENNQDSCLAIVDEANCLIKALTINFALTEYEIR